MPIRLLLQKNIFFFDLLVRNGVNLEIKKHLKLKKKTINKKISFNV